MTKKALLISSLLIASTRLFAQQTATDSVKQTVNTLFDAMRKGDSTLLKSTFATNMILQSISDGKDGNAILSTDSGDDFAKTIGAPHAQVYDERIVFDAVKVDGSLASVWAPYKFYLGDKFSHCGVDVFQLMKTPGGWKIIYIVDTRRKGNCPD
jgi:hypothetical protein